MLFLQCREIAREAKLTLPGTVQGFGQLLTNLKPVIELELNARFVASARPRETENNQDNFEVEAFRR